MSVFSLLVLTGFDEQLKANPNVIPPEFLYSSDNFFYFTCITILFSNFFDASRTTF